MGCYNDDLLFIHIPKTGGWSCKNYLRANVSGMLFPDDPASKLPVGHVRLSDIKHHTGRSADSWHRIIAVVRDPFEQQVSQACFWATRYLKGQRHIHDISTWKHVHPMTVRLSLAQAALDNKAFLWGPQHLDMFGFVCDAACDFHIWYENRQAKRNDRPAKSDSYADSGGFYRYWLTVDGEIPDNVTILRQETLGETFPQTVAEFVDNLSPRVMTKENTSRHHDDPTCYFTPASAAIVEAKFAWAFENYYPKMTWN